MITSLLKARWALCAAALGIVLLGLVLIPGRAPSGKAATDELPDAVTIKDPQRKRQALLDGAAAYLMDVRESLPADPAARANCDVAWQMAAADYDAASSRPFAVAAWLHKGLRTAAGICVYALNTRRETSGVEVTCLTPEGKVLKIVRQWPITAKFPSLMDGFAMCVEFRPLEQIIAAAKPDDEGNLLFMVAPGPETAMVLPEGVPIAVAVRDRNGEVSNFVPVVDLRQQELKP